MSDPTWDRVKSIFAELSELPVGERAARLEVLCGADASLRSEVQALLGSLENAGSFLGGLNPDGTTVGVPITPSLEDVGKKIGRYKLLQKIGEGGFGAVYMAEQEEPVRRKVALKIIKLGMDTKQVIARFEAERQALALMDHPNIARVLDAGATDAGRPYFVMELVRGVPITEYCDKNNLDTVDRLQLFLSVCGAIQHAHQKGVIHRDIKPNNVMVTLHDGVPVPKVIDFGIAKAINQRLTEKTLFTEFSQFIGTPQYMSPEQAEMSGLDVDTRADIYSLGVLLYELLTGTTPLEARRFREVAYSDLHRLIREEEPQRPSTRISTMGDAATATAKHRRTDVGSLRKSLSGDLDWIVMKALEKDRTRRYETANALLFDVRRHLQNEPVLASPPSAAYRIQKFVRRNRTAVSVVSVILATLSIGLGVAIFGLVQAERERAVAVKEAAAAADINAFFNDMLASVNPRQLHLHTGFQSTGAGPDVTARFGTEISVAEMLERAAGRIESSFADKPLLEARARETIAASLIGLEVHEVAARQLEAAIELRRAELGEKDRETLRTRSALVAACFYEKRYDEALSYALPLLETLNRELGEADPITLYTRSFQAASLVFQGEFAEADTIFEPTLALQREVLGSDHRDTIQTMILWANSYCWRNNGFEAEKLGREAYESARAKYSPDDAIVLESARACALALTFMARGAEALEIARPAYERAQRVVGPDHRLTAMIGFAIARSLDSVTDGQEEAALYAEFVRAEGETEWVPARDLGLLQLELGKTEEGLETFRLQHEFWSGGPGPEVSGLGPDRVEVVQGSMRWYYYRGLALAGRWDKARDIAQEELEALRAKVESDSTAASDVNDLAMFLLEVEPADQRDPELALEWATQAVEVSLEDSSLHAAALDTQAQAHRALGQTDRAFDLAERALEVAERVENIQDYAGGLGYYVAEVVRYSLETLDRDAAVRTIEAAVADALARARSQERKREILLDIGLELRSRGWYDWAESILARTLGEPGSQSDKRQLAIFLSEYAEAAALAGMTAEALRAIADARVLYNELFVTEEIDWKPGLGYLGEDGERTVEAVRIKRRLALALVYSGKIEEAEALAYEVSCISAYRGRLPLAEVYAAQGDWEIAAAYFRNLYGSIFLSSNATLYPGTLAHFSASFGRCLTELGRYSEAEPLLLQAHAKASDSSGGASLALPTMERWITDMYRRWGRPDLAAKWEI